MAANLVKGYNVGGSNQVPARALSNVQMAI